MNERPGQGRRPIEHPLFNDTVPSVAIILLGSVIALTAVAVLKPGAVPPLWSIPLVVFAAMAALLPAGVGAAVMLVRGSRGALTVVALAAGLTTLLIWRDLIQWSSTIGWILGVAAAVTLQALLLGVARGVRDRDIFPKPLRLATVAFVFKLALVGILAAAFIPSERNPLRSFIPAVKPAANPG